MAKFLEFSAFLFDPIRKIPESGIRNPESTQDYKDKLDFDIPSVIALLKWISSYSLLVLV
jgi:hypothetical protein